MTPKRPTGGTYRCTFTDEFNGTTIDSDKWLAQGTWYSGMTTGNHDCYVNTPATLSESGGAVHVSAQMLDQPFVCTSPYGDFTTSSIAGTIATRYHFDQTYGRFEFRARFPDSREQGLHSALWAYPSKPTYGPWPSSGEIDVAEWWSSVPDLVLPSVHYEGEPSPWSSGLWCDFTDPSRWHRYAVEWTRTTMVFRYDGQVCFVHAWQPAAPLTPPQPFDKPFYLVLTQAFGGGSNAVTPDTPRTATMDVDWARAWK
jgi:beta-glucanase (GH16 family)